MPPVIFGCMVFTRPSSISGKPVTSLTSLTGMPDSRSRRAVPPVEINSAPSSASPRAKSDTPVLSVTLMSTRMSGGLSRISRGRERIDTGPEMDFSRRIPWFIPVGQNACFSPDGRVTGYEGNTYDNQANGDDWADFSNTCTFVQDGTGCPTV